MTQDPAAWDWLSLMSLLVLRLSTLAQMQAKEECKVLTFLCVCFVCHHWCISLLYLYMCRSENQALEFKLWFLFVDSCLGCHTSSCLFCHWLIFADIACQLVCSLSFSSHRFKWIIYGSLTLWLPPRSIQYFPKCNCRWLDRDLSSFCLLYNGCSSQTSVIYTSCSEAVKTCCQLWFLHIFARSANFNTPLKKFWSVPSSFFFKDSTIWSRAIPHSSTVTRSCGSFLAGKPAEGKSVFSIASSSNSSEEHCYSLTSGKLMTRSCKPSYELRGKDTPKTNKDKYIN